MSIEETLPIRHDFVGEDAIPQGRFWRPQFALFFEDGTLWDTGGHQGFMRIRKSLGGPTVLDLHTYQGRIITGIRGSGSDQYNLALQLDHTVTQSLEPWGMGVYDLWLKDLSGRLLAVLTGHAVLAEMVTPPI